MTDCCLQMQQVHSGLLHGLVECHGGKTAVNQRVFSADCGLVHSKSADYADKLPGNGPAHGSRVSGQVVQGSVTPEYCDSQFSALFCPLAVACSCS